MSDLTKQLEAKPFVLQMKGMNKQFPGVKALDDVQLNLRAGTVHALMGENGAGKSTLMKCLFGIFHEDSGEILLNGDKVKFDSAKQALDHGVSMVHQELNQVQDTRIMDNIWLGRFPEKGIFIDEEKMYKDTKEIFERLDIRLDPRQKVRQLSVSEAQMAEIAKAVSYDSRIIVMDEPTSSLTEKEVGHLFKIIRALREDGVGIIYISHKMEEILEISDEVTIMRDGKYIATHNSHEITTDKIISLMVGRDLTNRFPQKNNNPSEVILKVENLTATVMPSVIDASFELKKGEILGVAGLVGSRRTELIETIFGARHKKEGKIFLHGKEIHNKSPKMAIDNGFALVTEERRKTGIFGVADILFNSVIANIGKYVKYGFLAEKQMTKDTDWVIDSLSVKTPGQKTKIATLSGGNQQKVILGRWLLTEPEILLLDEPTRGIDVGAKYDIYELMIEMAHNDKGVIMVSSEMPELLGGVTDRILVMSNGRVAGIVDSKTTTQEEILRLTAMYL